MLIDFPHILAIQSISLKSREYVKITKSSAGFTYSSRYRDGGYYEGRIQFIPIGVDRESLERARILRSFFEEMNDVVPGRIPWTKLDLRTLVDAKGNRIIQDAGLGGRQIIGTPEKIERYQITVNGADLLDDENTPSRKYLNIQVGDEPSTRLCYVRKIKNKVIEIYPDYNLRTGTTLLPADTLEFQIKDYAIERQNIIIDDSTEVQTQIWMDFQEFAQ